MAAEKIISGEEFEVLKAKSIKTNFGNKNTNKVMWGVAAAAYTLIVFFIGVAFEKNHNKSSSLSAINSNTGVANGFGGRQGRFANRLFGTVIAVTPNSITVQNSRSGTSSTILITSSTAITANQQTTSISSIAVGKTVLIALNPANTSDATSINVVTPPSTSPTSGSSTGL